MAQTRQMPPFWTPPQEVLRLPSRDTRLAYGAETPFWPDVKASVGDDGPDFALLPPVHQEGVTPPTPQSPADPLFLENAETSSSEQPLWGDDGPFSEPTSPWGWTKLPPPNLTDEELQPFRWLRYRRQVHARFRLLLQNVLEDHRHFYSWPTFRDVGLGLALGAVLANTSLDQHFQDWYQEDVRSQGLDNLSSFWKPWGVGAYFLPAYAGLAMLSIFCPDQPVLGPVGSFSARVSRAYLVGFPSLLFLQAMTGGSRPDESPTRSQWQPFEDINGLSGHAFIGAVPFITAAQMTDRPLLQAAFYLGSVFPAWSRLNDDAHYLSQVALGWWLAYLACRAVNQTETGQRPWTLVPIAGSNQIGLGLVFTR